MLPRPRSPAFTSRACQLPQTRAPLFSIRARFDPRDGLAGWPRSSPLPVETPWGTGLLLLPTETLAAVEVHKPKLTPQPQLHTISPATTQPQSHTLPFHQPTVDVHTTAKLLENPLITPSQPQPHTLPSQQQPMELQTPVQLFKHNPPVTTSQPKPQRHTLPSQQQPMELQAPVQLFKHNPPFTLSQPQPQSRPQQHALPSQQPPVELQAPVKLFQTNLPFTPSQPQPQPHSLPSQQPPVELHTPVKSPLTPSHPQPQPHSLPSQEPPVEVHANPPVPPSQPQPHNFPPSHSPVTLFKTNIPNLTSQPQPHAIPSSQPTVEVQSSVRLSVPGPPTTSLPLTRPVNPLNLSRQPSKRPLHVLIKQGTTTRRIYTKDLAGIAALEIQLPCSVVEVPDVPEVVLRALWALFHFTKGDYYMPEYPATLVQQLITADFLGADAFLSFVGEKLCVSPSLLNCSNSPEDIHRTVRDRYRLSLKVQLKYPSRDVCYVCKVSLQVANKIQVVCCGWIFHKSCIETRNKCPLCKEPWVALACCFCKESCDSSNSSFCYENYTYCLENRMSCCKADRHVDCQQKAGGCCPNCKSTGYPAKDVHEYCRIRQILRETEKQRKEAVGDYTS